MKTGKIVIGIISAVLVIGMFVLTFFADTAAEASGYTIEMKNIIWGSKETIQAGDPVSMKDTFGVSTSGINLLPVIGGIVAVASAVGFVVVALVSKSDKVKAILGSIFAILIVAGSIMQFYSVAMLPQTITNQAIAESVITEQAREEYLAILTDAFSYFKPGMMVIISGVLGCVGGTGVVVSAMLPSQK